MKVFVIKTLKYLGLTAAVFAISGLVLTLSILILFYFG